MSEPGNDDGSSLCPHVGGLEPRAEEILLAAGEGIYGLNLRGQVTFVNPAAAELTGHRPEASTRRSCAMGSSRAQWGSFVTSRRASAARTR